MTQSAWLATWLSGIKYLAELFITGCRLYG